MLPGDCKSSPSRHPDLVKGLQTLQTFCRIHTFHKRCRPACHPHASHQARGPHHAWSCIMASPWGITTPQDSVGSERQRFARRAAGWPTPGGRINQSPGCGAGSHHDHHQGKQFAATGMVCSRTWIGLRPRQVWAELSQTVQLDPEPLSRRLIRRHGPVLLPLAGNVGVTASATGRGLLRSPPAGNPRHEPDSTSIETMAIAMSYRNEWIPTKHHHLLCVLTQHAHARL